MITFGFKADFSDHEKRFRAVVNLLTIHVLDPVAKIPEFKVCAVKIQKVAA